MIKKVNVYPTSPIITLDIPLRTRVMGINMDTEDIRKCIIAQAIVEEVFPSGDIVRLNFSNYNKNNSIVKEEVKVDTSKPDDAKEEKDEFKSIDFKNLSRRERKKLNRQQNMNNNSTPVVEEKKEETPVEEVTENTEEVSVKEASLVEEIVTEEVTENTEEVSVKEETVVEE